MKKVVINPKGLVKDDTWLQLRKVRAIIITKDDKVLLSKELGIYIFPGGKCDVNETEEEAVIREIKEETGITIKKEELKKALEIEAFYDDFWDYRSQSFKPRYMFTTFFVIKTDQDINKEELNLTEDEIENNFNIFSCDLTQIYNLLQEEHTDNVYGKFFDEENRIALQVMNEILGKENH